LYNASCASGSVILLSRRSLPKNDRKAFLLFVINATIFGSNMFVKLVFALISGVVVLPGNPDAHT